MLNRKLVITAKDGFVRYGYFADGQPVELYGEPEQRTSLVGNIYAARVEKMAEGINGAFLEIDKGKKCYFPLSGKPPVKLTPGHKDRLVGGDVILLQITKDAVKTKLPVGSGNVSIDGKYFVLTLVDRRSGISRKITNGQERKRLTEFLKPHKEDGFGVVVRTNAEGVSEEELTADIVSLKERYRELMRKAGFAEGRTLLYEEPPYYITLGKELPKEKLEEIVTDNRRIYDQLKSYYPEESSGAAANKIRFYPEEYPLEKLYRMDHFYEEALQKLVWLKSGGSLVIEHTEAMTVIDVNTAGVTKKKRKGKKVFFEMNLEAAKEIARQLRLRNISGIIVIDFINMELEKEKEALLAYLDEECRKDRVRCRVAGITTLGLVEMTRDKGRKPLYEQLR